MAGRSRRRANAKASLSADGEREGATLWWSVRFVSSVATALWCASRHHRSLRFSILRRSVLVPLIRTTTSCSPSRSLRQFVSPPFRPIPSHRCHSPLEQRGGNAGRTRGREMSATLLDPFLTVFSFKPPFLPSVSMYSSALHILLFSLSSLFPPSLLLITISSPTVPEQCRIIMLMDHHF